MKMIEMFAKIYDQYKTDPQIKAKPGTLKHCQVACKYLCGAMTHTGMTKNGITWADIQESENAGFIRYAPNVGPLKRSGYTITSAGVKEVYRKSKKPT